MPDLLLALLTALLLDWLLGDPSNRLHPVAWMGKYIHWASEVTKERTPLGQFMHGLLLVLTGIALFTLPWFLINNLPTLLPFWLRWVLIGFLLKPVFALRRLIEAGREIERALLDGQLIEAQRLVGWHLVSRDTSGLTEEQVASAVIESLAENLTDSFFAPLFWFALLGLPAAWAYRFINTADAMIGYRTTQFEYLGKFAARLDDLLNWLPARLAALALVLAAGLCRMNARAAWQVMADQHKRTSSPNAGWTMAAAAGALDVRLEKKAAYQLNDAYKRPQAGDIPRAIRLVGGAAWFCLCFCGGLLLAQF